MDLGIAHGIYTSNTNGTINGVNNGVIHGTANGVYNELNSFDPSAQAFILAARINNMMQRTAVNNLVKSLKRANIWSKFTAIYPFVGGNARSHSFNLINTSLYQITFVGGVTHSANGIQGNGTNGYANTNLLGSALPQNDNHLAVYIRTNATDANYDIGTAITGTRVLGFRSRNGAGNIEAYNNDITLITAANAFPTGLQLHQRTASNAVAFYVGNGGLMSSNTSVSTGTIAFNILIGSVNISGSPSGFNARQYAFSSMGQSLNSAERTDFYNAINQYQTILNRNV
jgi:hypothetical protein